METIKGWILFVWGIISLTAYLALPLAMYNDLWELIIMIAFSLLCIFGGWRLAHNKKQYEKA